MNTLKATSSKPPKCWKLSNAWKPERMASYNPDSVDVWFLTHSGMILDNLWARGITIAETAYKRAEITYAEGGTHGHYKIDMVLIYDRVPGIEDEELPTPLYVDAITHNKAVVELDELRKKTQELQAKVDDLVKINAGLCKGNRNLNTDLKTKQMSCDALENALKEARRERDFIHAEILKHQQDHVSLSNEIRTLNAKDAQIRTLRSELCEANTECEHLKENLQSAQEELRALGVRYSASELASAEAQLEITGLRKNLQHALDRLSAMSNRVRTWRRNYRDLLERESEYSHWKESTGTRGLQAALKWFDEIGPVGSEER